MAKKKLTQDDLEKWAEKLGELLHLTYVDFICLQHHINFANRESFANKKFIEIFNYLYRMFFDRLYINIFKLLDKRSDVISLPNFYTLCNMRKRWSLIENNEVYKKIKSKRHNKLAHENLVLALCKEDDLTHYNDTKLHISEIKAFLEQIKVQFECVLDELGSPIFHYALGEGNKTNEFRDLLELAFKNP